QRLKSGVLELMGEWTPMRGTPQGAVISPLLANVYLHEFDLQIDRYGYRMVRYDDDFVILCDTQEQGKRPVFPSIFVSPARAPRLAVFRQASTAAARRLD